MPKLRLPPKKARKKPQPRKRASSKQIKPPEDAPTPQNSMFLAIPLELRMKIYENFEAVPPTADIGVVLFGRTNDRRSVLITRQSLWLVCRQVSQEWPSLFYRSSLVVVNGSRLQKKSDMGIWNWERLDFTWTEFNCRFLRHLPESSTRSIRKLTYDLWLPRSNSTDFRNAQKLLPLISDQSAVLGQLEELSISTQCVTRHVRFQQELDGLSREQIAVKVWEEVDNWRKWDALGEMFSNVLMGWQIVKEAHLEKKNYAGRYEVKGKKLFFTKGRRQESGDYHSAPFSLRLSADLRPPESLYIG